MNRSIGLERVLLALFVASGFAGLIYQAIWSHYLGLSLGHAAYAQTLVLAIFMGGMAVGAWLVSRRGVNWRRLIFAYAVVEIVIGLAGLAFHPAFLAYTAFSQDTVYPALSSPMAVRAWQWGSAALLIAPQSILLGMTFPLMSGGYLRVAPKADGEILGGLYFTNSIGAAFGALFATFVLLPMVGMPGAVAVAGAVNLLVGVLAWAASRRADAQPAGPAAVAPAVASGADRGFYRTMLLAACITGASSFVYEIGWVRMLNQALGTTVHSFELMLSAFILGLAFGGLWIRRRSARIGDAVAYAGYAQVWMGIAALVSLPVFAQSFHWVGALMSWLPRTDGGYTLFSLGSGVIALLVMFPAAFFAGMTLPLFTMALLRRGGGEAGIGRIYAANTLGAIVGVALAVHVLIPAMGLHLAVTLAALVDIVLGFYLLRRVSDGVSAPRYLGSLVATLLVLGVSLLFGRADPRALASGVFRTGSHELADDSRVHFLRDGKTATVSVFSRPGGITIATNGKPDAAMMLDLSTPPSDDEITMLMLGSMPLAAHPEPRRVAVIGWGSGLSTHTILGSDVPEVVDSIEIERAMHDGARLYGSRVERAYTDPRSHLHIDDARTYFSTGKRRYDVIVSEPSNPWVSGVSSLFTHQFYRFLSGHLDEGGVLVQWVHTYELSDELLDTMMAALASEFPYVQVYRPNFGDLVLVAGHSPLPPLHYPAAPGTPLAAELSRVGLASVDDYRSYAIGSQAVVKTLARLSGVEPYDDFHPVVALEAPRARFRGDAATSIASLFNAAVPILEMTDGWRPPRVDAPLASIDGDITKAMLLTARDLRHGMLTGDTAPLGQRFESMVPHVAALRQLSASVVPEASTSAWLTSAAQVADYSLAHIAREDQAGLWADPVWITAESQPEEIRRVLAAYDAAARRDAGAMREAGLQALAVLGMDRPSMVRDHMLAIALLGATASGDDAMVRTIEDTQGPSVPVLPGSDYGFLRAYLLAWADRPKDG